MKTIVKKMLLPAGICLTVLLIGCPQNNGFKPDVPAQPPPLTPQQTLDAEVDKVTLDVPKKANITAEELTQEDITSSGYDAASYAIKYETIKANSAEQKADITFFLKKEGVESKKRMVTITDFKAKVQNAAPMAQELINKEVDKVILTVTDKETITADELPAHKDKINASGYDTAAYTINYTVIKHDVAKREVEITFRLEKADLHSKTRTEKITGFKEKTVPPETIDIPEKTLLALFDLTETKITASAAAKKIAAAQTTTVGDYTFEEAKAVAYDDKAGTFTVKVKGKKAGKVFDKTFTISGFTHPYAGTSLGSVIGSEYLIFDKAIEENMALDTFIADANAAKGVGYTSFSYTLNKGGGKNAEFGIHSGYSLTARLSKVSGNKVKILADYEIMYKKLTHGESEVPQFGESYTKTVTENASYFTQDHVLKHVLDKTNENFVRVDANKFASYYYAMSKFGGTGFLNFDMNQIKKYVDLYRTKDEGEHLQIDIATGINNPKGGGIKANDFTGELTVDYCIATPEQLQNQSGIQNSKKVTRRGLKTIQSGEDIKKHFIFTVILSPLTEDSKNKWKDKTLQNVRLFYVDESSVNPSGVLTNPLPEPASAQNPYYLTLCDPGNPLLGSGSYGLSKDTNNRQIYIENIMLNKDSNSNKLKVSMQLCGGKIIEMTTEPFFGHGTP